MHFNRGNANIGLFSVLRFANGVIILLILNLFISCTGTNQAEFGVSAYMDSMVDRASDVAEIRGSAAAIRFIDSVYRNHKKANLNDQYEYYYFLHDRYDDDGNTEMADLYVDSIFWLIESTGNIENMQAEYGKAHILRADILFRETDYTEAYEYYYKAKVLAEKSTDTCLIGYYDYKVALVLYRGEKYGEAISHFLQAFDEMSVCDFNISYYYRTQEILDNIGLCYYNLAKPDSAILYYHKALKQIEQGSLVFGDSKEYLFEMANAVVYGNMGSAYQALGNLKKAGELFEKSIKINSRPGYDMIDAQYTRIKLAQLYLAMNKTEDAFAILVQTEQTQKMYPKDQVQLRWDKAMSHYWNKQNNKSKAYDHLYAYISLRDSLQTLSKRTTRMDIDYRVESLYKANEIRELKARDEKRTTYLLIASIVAFLLFTIAVLVVQNWRKSRKNIVALTKLNEGINEQKRKLEQLLASVEKSGREKDRILKSVSHDMRSPVNSALALTELLLADPQLNNEQKEYLELIKNSCTNALNLTRDLLEIATLTKDNIRKNLIDINKLVADTVELLNFRAARKNQVIHTHLLHEPTFIAINAEKIARVINNLVTNAIKFSPAGSVVYVAMREFENGIQISVHDNGIGIPDELKDKIFDVFTDAKRIGTSGEEPYGLGLSITKQIIDAHGGKIWFESEASKGTTFYIFLASR